LFGRPLIDLTTIEVVAWRLVTQLPTIPIPFEADFGQPPLITLHGYDLSAQEAASGDTLTLTLFWRALTNEIPANYTVFIHLVGPDEQIAAQGDGPPVYGFRPTTGWRAEEVLVDEHLIPIPAVTPPGTYRLWIGLYDPDSSFRPPPLFAGVVQPDGRLFLTEIIIRP
jgi:hypothetical protein